MEKPEKKSIELPDFLSKDFFPPFQRRYDIQYDDTLLMTFDIRIMTRNVATLSIMTLSHHKFITLQITLYIMTLSLMNDI